MHTFDVLWYSYQILAFRKPFIFPTRNNLAKLKEPEKKDKETFMRKALTAIGTEEGFLGEGRESRGAIAAAGLAGCLTLAGVSAAAWMFSSAACSTTASQSIELTRSSSMFHSEVCRCHLFLGFSSNASCFLSLDGTGRSVEAEGVWSTKGTWGKLEASEISELQAELESE